MLLRAGRSYGTVTSGVGELFRDVEATASSFARFKRALRMGLGDRHKAPKDEEALALFKWKLRRLDSPGLWKVALEVRRIFRDEIDPIELYDVHDPATGSETERARHGDRLTDPGIRREIKKQLAQKAEQQAGDDGK